MTDSTAVDSVQREAMTDSTAVGSELSESLTIWTWRVLEDLPAENSFAIRQKGVHALAAMLSQHPPSALEGAIAHLRAHSPFALLVEIATDAEVAGDSLTLSLSFSAMANLAVHLVPLLGCASAVGGLIGRALVMSSALCDRGVETETSAANLVSFCISAAHNLSAEVEVLVALHETLARGAPGAADVLRCRRQVGAGPGPCRGRPGKPWFHHRRRPERPARCRGARGAVFCGIRQRTV